jgi:hypothetical protein
VVDRANLDRVREEQGFQLSGEVDDDSAKAIGKILGAGAIVTGSFVNLGDVYGLTLKAINMETAMVAVSYPADIAKSKRIETLLASGGGAASASGRQPSRASAPAVSVVKDVYEIGETGPAGGIIFYDKGNNSDGWRYLEAAPARTETSIKWGSVSVKTTDGIGEGKKNTELIVAALNDKGENGAALFCDDFAVNGYNDWFLPSKGELNLMYMRLKAKNLGSFGDDWYWSSSEYSSGRAWTQSFKSGSQNDYHMKIQEASVRAVRAF